MHLSRKKPPAYAGGILRYNTVMSWASRRKGIYSGSTFAVMLVLALLGYVLFFYHAPTCSDGVQNGQEGGVDCGGKCQKICPAEALPPTILWSRSFEIVPGVWNSVAYVENQNADAGIVSIAYRFKLFGADNVIITERGGTTFLAPHATAVIVEPSLNVGQRIPMRTEFEFLAVPVWEHINEQTIATLKVVGSTLSTPESTPRISALIENSSSVTAGNIEATAIAFDVNDNAIAASKTLIPELSHGASQQVTFTWPQPFPVAASRIEVNARVPLTSLRP